MHLHTLLLAPLLILPTLSAPTTGDSPNCKIDSKDGFRSNCSNGILGLNLLSCLINLDGNFCCEYGNPTTIGGLLTLSALNCVDIL
ncbi:hypothetical protein EX30DRAFT_342959 [Ascodesmis nigricans]|uniref:Hydrophobin n=1 Tax=Ascodesmis nigricans TaxID=341454 RepID=A0A4S2MRP0_9PEZI|nr:hypothetical protein EX30DRAFT_342959 [Ascodesmis nigricans]